MSRTKLLNNFSVCNYIRITKTSIEMHIPTYCILCKLHLTSSFFAFTTALNLQGIDARTYRKHFGDFGPY